MSRIRDGTALTAQKNTVDAKAMSGEATIPEKKTTEEDHVAVLTGFGAGFVGF